MHSRSIFVLALCALTTPAFSQQPAPPSSRLAAFGELVGNWQGEGTVVPEEGMDLMPWTATIRFQPILGGYFFQEDTEVQVGAPTPLQMRTIYGWDAENERYVAFGMGNTGQAHSGTVHFPEDGTMVMCYAGMVDGRAVTTRTVWEFGGGKMSFHSDRANDAGPWYTEVSGGFNRVDATPKSAAEASFMNQPASGEMSTLSRRLAGTYDITGTMTMMPGMPPMEITGSETMTAIFGGHMLFSVVKGEAADSGPSYLGHTYMAWNASDRCYDIAMFSNMGEAMKGQSRFVGDDAMVTIFAGPMMGQLSAQRSILELGSAGVEGAISHSSIGTSDPYESFRAKYVRQHD